MSNPTEQHGVGTGPARSRFLAVTITAFALIAAACGDGDPGDVGLPADAPVAATATSTAFEDGVCSGAFVSHDLPHITAGAGDTASTFDGTGTGIALGDLDGDGDLDIVAPNLSGDTNVLFNEGVDAAGAPSFRAEPLIVGRFRQAAIVDVDGDRDADIVLSTGVGPPTLFDNLGAAVGSDPSFERVRLDGVDAATYAFAWSDLGGDGDLDLVTGSYNAELTLLRNSPVLGSDTGVVVHEQDETGGFVATRVASSAQALAVLLVDLDGDFDIDIAVGNDLATPDGLWIDNDGGWLEVEPFERTSFSTMSLDAGDVDNDGDLDLFSTDMKPRADDPSADERYVEVNADMEAIGEVDEVQRPENVLSLSGGDDDGFTNVAPGFGVDATGWSWSGLFGDLDADGLLDLYVVTGMRSDNLFAALDDNELIEPNQAFVNTGDGMERRPEWGLDDLTGGRGMAMGDVDGDGDLDIVVNNLNAPTRLFENQLCGGVDLQIELDWPGSRNPSAIGATVVAEAGDQRFTRTIDQSRGYLSGGPPIAHFGLGTHAGDDGAEAVKVTVLWPDGTSSTIDGVDAGSRTLIEREPDGSAPLDPADESPSESGG